MQLRKSLYQIKEDLFYFICINNINNSSSLRLQHCENVETLQRKNDLSWDVILTSLLPSTQSCSSKIWAWSYIASNFDKGWRGITSTRSWTGRLSQNTVQCLKYFFVIVPSALVLATTTFLATKMPIKAPARHTFWYIFFCRHDYDVRLYIVTFYGEVINMTKNHLFFLFLNLSVFREWIHLQEIHNMTYHGTIGTKFERARIHFTNDVFAADTVVVAKNFWTLSLVWYRHQSQHFAFISLSFTTNLNRDGSSLSILRSGLPLIMRASNCLDCLDTWAVVQKYRKFPC